MRTEYAKIDLEHGNVLGVTWTLPAPLARVKRAKLADLGWAGQPGIGYWPVQECRPNHNPFSEVTTEAGFTLDLRTKAVWRLYTIRARGPEDEAAELLIARDEMWQLAERWREHRLSRGLRFRGRVFAVTPAHLTALSEAKAQAEAGLWPAPPEGGWRTLHKAWMPLDAAGISALAEAAQALTVAIEARHLALEREIEAATDVMMAISVAIESGWPR